ncbi:hypothetical protein D3C78_698950 [compost metagenome]
MLTPGIDRQRHGQGGQHPLEIRGDAHVGGAALAELGGIHIQVDHPGLGGELFQLAGHPIIEAGAHYQQQIALLHRIVGSLGAVHAEHAEIDGAVGIQRAYPLEGGDRRHAGDGGKVAQLLLSVGHAHSSPDVEHGALGSGQQGAGQGQLGRIEGLWLLHRKQRALGRHGGQLHILGKIDEHRTRTPLGGDGEGFRQHPTQIGSIGHHEGVLGAGEGHAEHVDLLKRIGAHGGAGDLTADGDQGHGIEQRLRQAGHQVGGPRARGGDADPHLTGGAGITHGGQGGPLLVTAELMGQATVIQGVIDRHDGPARVTKHLGHTLFLESLYQKLRAVHVEILSFGRKKTPGP